MDTTYAVHRSVIPAKLVLDRDRGAGIQSKTAIPGFPFSRE